MAEEEIRSRDAGSGRQSRLVRAGERVLAAARWNYQRPVAGIPAWGRDGLLDPLSAMDRL